MDLDYYEVLGVNRDASEAEIKSAFRKLAKTHHPDGGGNPLFFRLVEDAYNTLRDPVRRRTYDRSGRRADHADEPSAPPGQFSMPPLVGLTLAQTKLMVSSLDLSLEIGEVVVNSGDEAVGLVVEQDPLPGKSISRGDSVAVLWARPVTAAEVAGAIIGAATGASRRYIRKKLDEADEREKAARPAREAAERAAAAAAARAEHDAQRAALHAQRAAQRNARHLDQIQAQAGTVTCSECSNAHDYYVFNQQIFGGRPSHPLSGVRCPQCQQSVPMAKIVRAPCAVRRALGLAQTATTPSCEVCRRCQRDSIEHVRRAVSSGGARWSCTASGWVWP